MQYDKSYPKLFGQESLKIVHFVKTIEKNEKRFNIFESHIRTFK